MTPRGHTDQLEARRRLAVTRVHEGWKQKDVAAFLGVSLKAVSKWVAAYRAGGEGLASRPHPGAKPRLTQRQERAVLSLLARQPQAFGYRTDLWTTRRLAEVIAKRYKIRLNSNYLAAWLRKRGYAPQKPEVGAVERDNPAIARRVAEDWQRIKKNQDGRADLIGPSPLVLLGEGHPQENRCPSPSGRLDRSPPAPSS